MNVRMIVGLIVGLIPVVIFGRLLPVLVPLAILVIAIRLFWYWISSTVKQRRNARRWSAFSQDQAWAVTAAANSNPEARYDENGKAIWVGSIRLDFKQNLIAIDVHASGMPSCVRADAIQEISLVDLSMHPSAWKLDRLMAINLRLKGEKFGTRYYADDAGQIIQAIEGMRASRARRSPVSVAA